MSDSSETGSTKSGSFFRTNAATKIRTVGKYVIFFIKLVLTTQHLGNRLGKGQFGCTYKAMNTESGNFFAIKEVELSSVPKDVLSNIKVLVQLY